MYYSSSIIPIMTTDSIRTVDFNHAVPPLKFGRHHIFTTLLRFFFFYPTINNKSLLLQTIINNSRTKCMCIVTLI